MPKLGSSTKATTAMRVIAALKEHFPARWKPSLGGHVVTRAQLIALFEEHIAALGGVSKAHARLRAAVAEERRVAREASDVEMLLKLVVRSELGAHSLVYASFGWKKPKKPGPKTTQAKARMVERARANRDARKKDRR